MKKNKILAAVLIGVFLCAATGSAKKLDILKLDKGETTNDGIKSEVSLSEEHAIKKGSVSLKVTATEDGGGCIAECPPKRGVWDGYDVLKIGIFNPLEEPLSFNFVIKPKSPIKYEDRSDTKLLARPGHSDLEVDLAGVSTNGGGALVLKDRIAIWSLSPSNLKKDKSYFVQYLRAYTNDELEKEEKTAESGFKK